MNKLFIALLLTVIGSTFVSAQSKEYRKTELFAGYSNNQVDRGDGTGDSFNNFLRDRENFNGFEVSGVYNVHRYLGVKADFSGSYHSDSYSFTAGTGPATQTVGYDYKSSLYNVLGGVQIKDNASEGRFKPFAHALIGAGHARSKVENLRCTPTSTVTCGIGGEGNETGFAGAFGGGLDIKLSNRVDLRAFQVDYNPIKFDGYTTHNVRFGIGFVFK